MSTKILRVGVLGQGRSGYDIHVRWLREAKSQYQVVAVADQLPERQKDAVTELGAKGFNDYHDLLQDKSLNLDLVVNAMPSFLHPQGTIDALNAGYHVICEKPFATTVKDADRMAAAARKNGRRLFPFQNSRFQPGFAKLREVIASGKLGQIVSIRISFSGFGRRWDWQTLQKFWGGNINNTGPHPLDQAVILFHDQFGGQIPEVWAKLFSVNPFGDADNYSQVILSAPKPPVIEVLTSSFTAYPQGDTYNVGGSCGGLSGNPGKLTWKYFDPAKAPARRNHGGWSDSRGYNSEKLDWIEESWELPADTNTFMLMSQLFYNNIYDVLVNGAEPVVRFDQVRRQVRILEECHRQNPLPVRVK